MRTLVLRPRSEHCVPLSSRSVPGCDRHALLGGSRQHRTQGRPFPSPLRWQRERAWRCPSRRSRRQSEVTCRWGAAGCGGDVLQVRLTLLPEAVGFLFFFWGGGVATLTLAQRFFSVAEQVQFKDVAADRAASAASSLAAKCSRAARSPTPGRAAMSLWTWPSSAILSTVCLCSSDANIPWSVTKSCTCLFAFSSRSL